MQSDQDILDSLFKHGDFFFFLMPQIYELPVKLQEISCVCDFFYLNHFILIFLQSQPCLTFWYSFQDEEHFNNIIYSDKPFNQAQNTF